MGAANAYNPLAAGLTGLAGNQQFTQGLSNWMGGGDARGYMPTNFGTGSAFGNQDLGSFL
jgi:hypothetical protein